MQYYVYLHASSTYTQGLSLKTHNLPTAVTLRCQITIIFPSTSKRRSLQLCGKPKRCLLSSFLFFFKEIFLWKCTARSYQQWCTSTDFANLDTQPPSFTNLKLNILFKCNPLKCFNAAKCHQVYGKGRESRQNRGDKTLFQCISCPFSWVPLTLEPQAKHIWKSHALVLTLWSRGRTGMANEVQLCFCPWESKVALG